MPSTGSEYIYTFDNSDDSEEDDAPSNNTLLSTNATGSEFPPQKLEPDSPAPPSVALRALPTELLAIIFEFAVHDNPPSIYFTKNHPLYSIIRVCRRWRNVAVAIPKLWREFVPYLCHNDRTVAPVYTVRKQLAILKAGDMHVRMGVWKDHDAVYFLLISLEQAHQWAFAQLSLSHLGLALILSRGPFPRLHKLELSVSEWTYFIQIPPEDEQRLQGYLADPEYTSFPQLRELTVYDDSTMLFKHPLFHMITFSQLRICHLWECDADNALTVLSVLGPGSQLSLFKCSGLESDATLRPPFVVSISQLDFYNCCFAFSTAVLRKIGAAPLLTSFLIDASCDTLRDLELLPFFERSGCALETLQLCPASYKLVDVMRLLRLPSVRTISVLVLAGFCIRSHLDNVACEFSRRTKSRASQSNQEKTVVVPSLQRLELWYAPHLISLNMLEALHRYRGSTLEQVIMASPPVEGQDGKSEKRVNRLMARGLQVTWNSESDSLLEAS
ncbi:F-box domain-containing protein [Mycena indigotica]|uniref:F-box domain-containing protein n=1 Tax=Mycena indigotica TaxID=2126181 RepID=A0A8H6T7V2_9AGAR|nr:F-box domain-containing protein [Mycena indigotica]KAF7312668.1 F-box domain-containing protein [Mycena indigotica]